MAYPLTIDNTTTLPQHSAGDAPTDHVQNHNAVNAAVIALETKVGINSSADNNSIDYRVASALSSIASINSALTNYATKVGVETLTNKTLTSPIIGDFSNANHSHINSANGGSLGANTVGSTQITDKSITNAKLDDTIGGAWLTWAPTITNLSVGNGILISKYKQIGKTVNLRLSVKGGTTTNFSSSGAFYFTLPQPAASDYIQASNSVCPIGNVHIERNGVANYQGFLGFNNSATTTVQALMFSAPNGGGYTAWSPFTNNFPWSSFGNNDIFECTACYEAA